MSDVNWGALQSPNVFGAFQAGMQQGRETKRQAITDNALAAYAQNPNDTQAVNALMVTQPDVGFRIRGQQQQAAAATREADIKTRAASGDPKAIAELAGIDFDAWSKLAEPDKAKVKARTDYIGQAALAVSQLPEEQRAQAWDGYISQAPQMGVDGLEGYQGKYSQQALNAALASAGQVKTFLDTQEPKYVGVPAESALVNVRDPQAVAQFQGGAATAQATPPAAAVEYLRKNPSMKDAFDAKYGRGASDQALGGAPSQGGATFRP